MKDLVFDNVRISYGENVIFDGFSHVFEGGKINCVLGASGIGKSTLLNAVAGLVKYDGSITGNEDKISYIFQNDRLIPTISLYKNLDLVIKGVFADKKERAERIRRILHLAELDGFENARADTLSGGQAQRAAFARAFVYPSSLVLMDEPFKALDVALKARLLKAFLNMHAEEGRTVIFVTHAVDECLLAADNVLLVDGKPAVAKFETKIERDWRERSLADEESENVRRDLLKNMV